MFRVFDPTSGDLVFWGERFNLREIVTEVERLLPLVRAETSEPDRESSGSSGSGGTGR